MGMFLTLIPLIFEAIPHAIKGVEAAKQVIELGAKIFGKAVDEGREPTDEEIAQVRAIRGAGYDDFYTDDEAQI